MDTSSRTQIVHKRSESVKFSSTVNISSRRSLSGSFPTTSLHHLGVPFSWERLPGKPKEFPYHRKNESSNNLLPLPPHRSNHIPNTRRNKNTSSTAMKDPFMAALVECSKDATAEGEHNNGGESRKVLRKRSSFGLLNLYASCRRVCEVSKSIVYLPRSNDRVLGSYDQHLLLGTRRRQ